MSGSRVARNASTSALSGYLEAIERCDGVAHQGLVVALGDSHPGMGRLHVSSQIEGRPAGRRRDEIHRQLTLSPIGIDAAGAGPEPRELRVAAHPLQQTVDHRGDGVVSTQARVQGLLRAL
jgi:hypothetical protein